MHWRRHGRGGAVRGGPLIAHEYEIRQARREELTLLPPLLLQAAWRYRDAGFIQIAERVENLVISAKALEHAHDAGLVHIAFAPHADVTGFIASSDRDGMLHVMELQVLPEHGRDGVGGRLLEAHAALAAASGCPAVTLACFRSVPWQLPFYAKNGFVEYPPGEWTPTHKLSWAAQEKFGLDMTDRAFLIRDVAPGYAVRRALNSDLHSLSKIEYLAGQRFASAGMPQIAAMTREDLFPTDLARRLARDGSLWVAVHDEIPVGFAAAEETDGYGYLYELDVLPEHAGQKLGWTLVNTVEAWARTNGLRGVTLSTFREIAWNRPYYERMGFSEWPRADLTPGHEKSWRMQARNLDMTKRLFMIKSFDETNGAA